MKIPKSFVLLTACCLLLTHFLSSCDFLFGSKQDDQVDQIFEQGAIDPNLVPNQVGYVPLLPFWNGIPNPVDVYVGYDEMIYVVDDNGVDIFDQKGEKQRTILLPGATDVVEDRELNLYVAARANRTVDGYIYNLAAVFKIAGASTADGATVIDTFIQPFCDVSRNNTAFRGPAEQDIQFTGLATLADNTLLVSRTGSTNSMTSVARPDNTILFFNAAGVNTGYSIGLNPTTSSLKSELNISSITSFAAPPQLVTGISTSRDFLLLQDDPAAQFKALWIKESFDPNSGEIFSENAALLNFDTSKASRFLYEPDRFVDPKDIYVAPDFSGYIFIVDAGTDSLYQFTQKGFEGVNPPPNSSFTKQVIASFGGAGSGPFQFVDPSGVCYFKKVVYVADKGNNRICRYKLSTDLE